MLDILLSNIDLLINIVLAFITGSLGLNLSRKDFSQIFEFPKPLSIGLVAQMILLPLTALVMMLFSDFNPEIKVGFIIISLCPGGVTSNLVNYLLKGNVALSISLTVINGLLCMFTVPLLTNLSMNFFLHESHDIALPVWNTILHIGLITVIPAAVGMYIRSKLPKIADRLRPILKYLLPSLLFLIFIVKIFASEEQGGIELKQHEIWDLGIQALALNFGGMFLGYLLGFGIKINFTDRITIMVEVGLQNTALALYISSNILHNTNMQKPAIVYAMVTFASTMLFAWVIKSIILKFILKNKHE
jgi:bile acid:Na+ symporter, BASS family